MFRFQSTILFLCTAVFAVLLPSLAHAQKLTGAVLCAATVNGNYSGAGYWTTGNGPSWRVYFQQDGKWLNDDNEPLSVPLSPGTYTLRFFAEPVGADDRFALNLFFDDDEDKPAISVFATTARSKVQMPAFSPVSGKTMRLDTKETVAANTAATTIGGLSIEVTTLRIQLPTVEPVDVVNKGGHNPDGNPDLVGTLTLRVSKMLGRTQAPSGGGSLRYGYSVVGESGEPGSLFLNTGTALNNKGQVVLRESSFPDGVERDRTIVWQDGKRTVLPNLGFKGVRGEMINENGDVAGTLWRKQSSATDGAFLWHDGKMIDLGISAKGRFGLTALTADRKIYGWIEETANAYSFVWESGKITKLPFLIQSISDSGKMICVEAAGKQPYLWDGIKRTELKGLSLLSGGWIINNKGEVAFSMDGPPQSAHILAGGSAIDLGRVPNMDHIIVIAMNNAGQALCRAGSDKVDAGGDVIGTGCIWSGGKLYDLNNIVSKPEGAVIVEVMAINDRGEILAAAKQNKRLYAVLLTPK